jgi:hypothetical protein
MPKTLNPVNTFPTSIPNFPLAGNDEPLTLGPLEAAIQAVLDRTENLHQSRLTLEGIGTKRIRQFASRSALSAASGFADGDIVSVDGYGLYRLFVSSSATVDGLWVLTASGGGRWIHLERDLKGANLGLATLDGSGRLAQDVRDNSIASAHIVNGAVTAAKLASGAVVGHLGYTPVNKAGDTMSGALSLPQANTTAGTSAAGNRHIELRTAGLRWALGLGGNESGSNAGANFYLWRYDDAGNFLGEVFRAERDSGRVIVNEISGRYDHQNRFVVQAYTPNITVLANDIKVIGSNRVSLPSGKSLYLRRVRWSTFGTVLRPRIASTLSTWTGSDHYGEIEINQQLSNSSLAYVELGIVNSSGSNTDTGNGAGIWAEFEIR